MRPCVHHTNTQVRIFTWQLICEHRHAYMPLFLLTACEHDCEYYRIMQTYFTIKWCLPMTTRRQPILASFSVPIWLVCLRLPHHCLSAWSGWIWFASLLVIWGNPSLHSTHFCRVVAQCLPFPVRVDQTCAHCSPWFVIAVSGWCLLRCSDLAPCRTDDAAVVCSTDFFVGWLHLRFSYRLTCFYFCSLICFC